MSDFKPRFGIDLGTTFSTIAYIDEHDKPVVIPNQEYKTRTPSVVNFEDKDTFGVGDEAVNRQIADQENTVSFIKRRMDESGVKLFIHGEEYTPEKISALILGKLKRDAEIYFQSLGLDVEVKDVVITVPSYFGMVQKGATKEAGELAGLNVLSIITAPTAAALAFGVDKLGKDQTVFVFDLGGGTFDVTILEIGGDEIKMISSDGSPELGGKDWDDILIVYCLAAFKEKYGEDPQDDPNSFQEIYERVLRAKISLSNRPKATIQISHNGKRANVEITREKFESLSKDLLAQCKTKCESVLEKANKKWSDIDTVLLVGGSTYMPMVRRMIEEVSGKEPSTDVNPNTFAAIGAAYQARLKGYWDPIPLPQESILLYNIGLQVLNDEGNEDVAILFPKDTKLPAELSESYGFAYNGQTNFDLKLIEGIGNNVGDYWEAGDINAEFKQPKKAWEPCDVVFFMPQYGIIKTQFKCANEEVNTETRLTGSKKKVEPSVQHSDDFEKINKFLSIARTIDIFKNCQDIFDVLGIKDKNASYFEIEKQITQFVDKYSATNAPKFKNFCKLVVSAAEAIRRILKEKRPEYHDYLLENNPKVKELKIHFKAYTKDSELDAIEKKYLLNEAKSLGILEDEALLLIDRWLLESGACEVQSSSGASEFDLWLTLTCYEMLGVSKNVESPEIKAAFEKAYKRYMALGRTRAFETAKFERINAAYDILIDPQKRKKYDKRIQSERDRFKGDFPYLVIEGKEDYLYKEISRGAILVERIVIRNPAAGVLQGSIRPDVPWLEPDRNKIIGRHEQDLLIRIFTSKIPEKQYEAEGTVTIESNGGMRTIHFQVSLIR